MPIVGKTISLTDNKKLCKYMKGIQKVYISVNTCSFYRKSPLHAINAAKAKIAKHRKTQFVGVRIKA